MKFKCTDMFTSLENYTIGYFIKNIINSSSSMNIVKLINFS